MKCWLGTVPHVPVSWWTAICISTLLCIKTGLFLLSVPTGKGFDVMLKSTSRIVLWFPQKLKPLHRVATSSQFVWWDKMVSQSAQTENDAASLPTSPPSELLWNACQAAACVGGDCPKISMTWHISVTYYLAAFLLLCGIYRHCWHKTDICNKTRNS